MAVSLEPDHLRSASHRNMADHLCGPFLGAAVESRLPIDAQGHASLSVRPRVPLLLAVAARPIDRLGLRLHARLDGATDELPALEFLPYTESGASLPIHIPEFDPLTGTSAIFGIRIALEWVDPAGVIPVPGIEVAGLIEIRLLEGHFGRLIYAVGAEKQRIRRQAREISAMRLLSRARGDALDRFGADLAVPRFTDRIRFEPSASEIVSEPTVDASGNPVPEPDEDYRRRLGIYHQFLMPSRRSVLRMLNGPGTDQDPNQGPLGALGLLQRFVLTEKPNDFAVAIRLIAAGGDQVRLNFLQFVRNDHLVFPNDAALANDIHARRLLASRVREGVERLRHELRKAFQFDDAMGIAPKLAEVLRTLARCLGALGFPVPVRVLRAQDPAAGSRYELGLGVDILPFTPAQLDQMIAALQDPNRAKAVDPDDPSKTDMATEGLLASLTPKAPNLDPEGSWLLSACGIRTVHRIDAGTLYMSAFPTFGLVIETPAPAPPGMPLQAFYQAPADPGKNAALKSALDASLPIWTSGGGNPWTVLSDAEARALWDQPMAQTPPGAMIVFSAAGLPAISSNAGVVPRLKIVPPELLDTIRLDLALTQGIMAGNPAAAASLKALSDVLRTQGIVSVLPMMTAPDQALLVTSVVGLPEAGINLSDRRATGFRWYVVPLVAAPGTHTRIRAVGSRSMLTTDRPGLFAVVVVGYVRRGQPDPYEVRVELPAGAHLDLIQYEFLMNLLEQIYPVGVEVNTFSIRREHVDLDGDGQAEPLPPTISRTYRRYHRSRLRGEMSVTLD